MDKSLLDNHPALQVIREDESDEEIDQVQVISLGPLNAEVNCALFCY